jgi:hypothetical protein
MLNAVHGDIQIGIAEIHFVFVTALMTGAVCRKSFYASNPSKNDFRAKESGTKYLAFCDFSTNCPKTSALKNYTKSNRHPRESCGFFVCLKRFLLCLVAVPKVPCAYQKTTTLEAA